MDDKDKKACLGMVRAIAGLTWDKALCHVSYLCEALAANVVGTNALNHREACDRFAKAFGAAFARLMAEMADNDEASKESN